MKMSDIEVRARSNLCNHLQFWVIFAFIPIASSIPIVGFRVTPEVASVSKLSDVLLSGS
jgi:hypothetical protein